MLGEFARIGRSGKACADDEDRLAHAPRFPVVVEGVSSPLPLVGRGRGRGSRAVAPLCPAARPPTPTLPHKGGGRRGALPYAIALRAGASLVRWVSSLRALTAQPSGRSALSRLPPQVQRLIWIVERHDERRETAKAFDARQRVAH